MPDYSNSTIYKIICKDPSIIDSYIGSTTNFKKRIYAHKDCVNNYKSRKHKYKLYQFIREHGGWNNFIITPIIKYNCETKLEVAQHERFYIDAIKPSLNDQIPLRTRKEWIEANRNKVNKYANNYYHGNKDKCLAAQKKWVDSNKDKVKKIKTEYYNRNKSTILKKRREKYKEKTNPL